MTKYAPVDLGGRKKLPLDTYNAVKDEIKLMLHAGRDAMRNQGKDTSKRPFDHHDGGYYGEAWGVARSLVLLGYASWGADCGGTPNVKQWFRQLEQEVLDEEGFGSHGNCDWCMERYRKDDSTYLPTRTEFNK